VPGVVEPDGVTVLVDGAGRISIPTATASILGLVKGDGSTVSLAAGVLSVVKATTSQLGAVKPDGTSITVASDGTISAAGGGSGLTNPMTTSGDIIIGGSSGTPARLAADTSGYVLTSNGPGEAPSWQAASGGGGGSLTSGAPLYLPNTLTGTNIGWAGYSFVGFFTGLNIWNIVAASGWKLGLRTYGSGGVKIAAFVIYRCALATTTIVDVTTVTVGSSSTPTLTTPSTVLYTDPIAVALDQSHDNTIALYVDPSSSNSSGTASGASGGITGGYVSGNKANLTAGGTAPGVGAGAGNFILGVYVE
jgi:hypothetical protein